VATEKPNIDPEFEEVSEGEELEEVGTCLRARSYWNSRVDLR